MKTVAAYLRMQGIHLFVYLADWFSVSRIQRFFEILYPGLSELEVPDKLGGIGVSADSVPPFLGDFRDFPRGLAFPTSGRFLRLQSLLDVV